MGFSKPKYAETGSARWWGRILTDVGLRLTVLIFLVVVLSTHHYSSGTFWSGVAFAILTTLLLLPKVAVLILVALRRLPRESDDTPPV